MNNFKISKNTEWKEVEINGEIKEIPIEWGLNTVEKTKSIFIDGDRGANYPSKRELSSNGFCAFLDAKNISKNKFSLDKLLYMSEEKDKKLRKGKLEKNDLIITTRGTLGNIAHYSKNIYDIIPNARINSGMVIFKPSNLFDINYVTHLLKSNFWQKQNFNDGGVIPQLTIAKLKETKLLIPPIDQQSSIASILFHQESIINDMETLVEKYETRLRYLSEELLSGRLRIKEVDGKTVFYKNTEWKEVEVNGEMKEIPVDWEVEKVRQLFDCSMGQTILSKDVTKKKSGNSIPVYSATEDDKYFGFISENKIRNILSKNDIVIPARGNSIGYCKLIKEKSTSTQTTIQLKSKEKINSSFVFYSFKKNKESFFPVNPGAIPQLTVAEVNDLSILIPSESECLNISNVLLNQSNIIDDMKDMLEKESQKFTFLLNSLLSGIYQVEY